MGKKRNVLPSKLRPVKILKKIFKIKIKNSKTMHRPKNPMNQKVLELATSYISVPNFRALGPIILFLNRFGPKAFLQYIFYSDYQKLSVFRS